MALQAPNLFVTEPIPSGHVRFKTSLGPIEIELWPRETPLACRNFVQLCLEGYYEGLIFHRIVPGFIVQTGDPTGSGSGGESIYDEGTFNDEINARLKFTRRGLVAMANLGSPNTNTSQFFVTLDRTEELQDKHTIFGSVIGDTIYNVMKLGEVEIDKNERPIHPPIIKSVEVIDNPFPDIVPRITSAQRKEQAKARKEAKKEKQKEKMLAKHKALAKNKGLLSFAEEEKLTETSDGFKNRKLKSAHDLEASSQLSQAVLDQRPSLNQLNLPENFKSTLPATIPENPLNVHEALRAVVGRERSGPSENGKTNTKGSPVDDSSNKKGKGKNEKKSKESNTELSAAVSFVFSDQVKADIIKMQAELKKMSKRNDSDSDSEEDKTKGKTEKTQKRKVTHDGHSLLEEERKKYKARAGDKKTAGRGAASEAESILDSFRRKLREAKPLTKPAEEAERVDGYAGEVDPTQDGVLGDVDGDDDGWMAHTLQFRKDATADLHKVDEYAVIDPLRERKLTLDELEARKNEKRFDNRPQPRNSDRRKKK
ncbi:Peptidyl-prolyl isomerase cwc27 [Puccinia graminis f. sp. tritici]|uniref:Peptidyl-prolyl isomerase CWC27 n=1 Tax=Puccinia graminis f. sp. tritici TaxID=56615 RepID=A0A5B0PCN6_PUCGR|nr:Peptidyl-prolyl isomerase cwc27 [Puccinia graminis f. sp. tritici]KAA1100382.1 Peptidyl-prolyl isomerase cwc27 [Puccinia graminis f. sp. tritici]